MTEKTRTCETCRWHRHLKVFDTHICEYRLPDGTQVGPISRLDADCDAWEDAHKCSGCPECIVRFDAEGIHGHVPDNNSSTCRGCEHNDRRME